MADGIGRSGQDQALVLPNGVTKDGWSTTHLPDDDNHARTEKLDREEEREGLLGRTTSRGSSPVDNLHLVHDVDIETTTVAAPEDAAAKVPRKKDVSWRSLPHKDQLLILTLARLAEPLYMNSLSSYMFFMLQSFDPSLDDAAISSQAGILTGAFTAAQCFTAVWWGRLADKPWMGRKNIILIGLTGSFFSSIGFGFAKNFWIAIFFRTLGGALNGNVGVMRTMISELIKEKKYQPKAFLILPATFNFGVLVGPLLGGYLASPVELYPGVFGPGSKLGGEDGVQWLIRYPYALPNLLNATVFLLAITLIVLGLQETLVDRAGYEDMGLGLGHWLKRLVTGRLLLDAKSSHDYFPLDDAINGTPNQHQNTHHRINHQHTRTLSINRPKLPYRRIFTKNVLVTMATHGLLHIHLAAFNNLWFLFLSTPRFDPSNPSPPDHLTQKLPYAFTGGLGMPAPTVGLAIGIIGFVGLLLQLGVYSMITFRLGLLLTHRLCLLLIFPLVYSTIPYLAVIPTKSAPPAAADGVGVWIAIFSLLAYRTFGHTFTVPITQILINNASPHPSVLGAVHGIGQSVSSGCRTLGPVIWSSLYGVGLEKGMVGIAWWALAVESLGAAGLSWFLREGSGHEILLEGEEEEG